MKLPTPSATTALISGVAIATIEGGLKLLKQAGLIQFDPDGSAAFDIIGVIFILVVLLFVFGQQKLKWPSEKGSPEQDGAYSFSSVIERSALFFAALVITSLIIGVFRS
jgi:hypothetical protein